jgi:hypothetical protein
MTIGFSKSHAIGILEHFHCLMIKYAFFANVISFEIFSYKLMNITSKNACISH